MSIIQGTGRGGARGFYDFPIEQSLRFDGSSYLTRNPSTTSNRKTWTWSSWVKLGSFGSSQFIFGANSGSYLDGGVSLTNINGNNIGLSFNGNTYNKYTSSVFRDTSAWYHIVVALATDNATAADRIKIYVNGVEQTNYFTQNSGLPPSGYTPSILNTTNIHVIGTLGFYFQNYFDGYLANIQFIDGQALDQYFFGEFKDNIWVPYNAFSTAGSGTATASDGDTATDSYGTNGFHLDFADSSNIGNDVSGNNNDWTVN